MSRRSVKYLVFAVCVAFLAAGAIWLPVSDWLTSTILWIQQHPGRAWLVFVLAYVLATVLLIPGSLLTLAAGFVFGLPVGTVLVSAGSTLGATAAFMIGRHLARDWIERRIEGRANFEALDRATRHSGFIIVLLARLSPLFPFNLLNYGLALTAVRARDYILASWAGMLPATVLYVYIGTVANDLSELTGGQADSGMAGRVLLIGGLVATAVLTVLITRRATKILDQELRHRMTDREAAP